MNNRNDKKEGRCVRLCPNLKKIRAKSTRSTQNLLTRLSRRMRSMMRRITRAATVEAIGAQAGIKDNGKGMARGFESLSAIPFSLFLTYPRGGKK